MIQSNIRFIVGLVIGFIVAFLITKNLLHEPKTIITEGDKTVEVKLVTKIDTLKIKQYIHVVDTVKVPTLIAQDTVFKEGSKEVALIPGFKNTYQDSVKVQDSVYVGYKAHVLGELKDISLLYHNTKSIVVIHKTDSIFKTTTITKPNRGLYAGIDIGLGFKELSPSLQFVNNKNIYGVKYNLVGQGITPMQNVQLTYARKLF